MKVAIPKRLFLLVLVLGMATVLVALFGKSADSDNVNPNQAISERIVLLKAKGGYFPKLVTVQANVQSTLRVITDKTYDCTSALRIPELDVDVVLPPTGNTDFELPPRPAGTVISGGCTSDHEQFLIKYQ